MPDDIRFAPKDAKIIKDNPGKSPYELKELGLSDPAFEKLMTVDQTESLQENPSVGNDKADHPALPPDEDLKNKLIPKLQAPVAQRPMRIKAVKNQVTVVTPNGVRNTMGRTFAMKLVKNDKRYKILD